MTQMLTARQEAFCRLFVGGAGSAAEAARQAGYAAHTARAQASRLLHTPAVSARIDALRADTEQACATLCARLMADTRRLTERAEAEGKLSLAMRGIAMQMNLVKQFGLPAMPEDTTERTLDGLGAEPAAVCGDVAVGEPDVGEVGAAPVDVAATTAAQAATFIPPWVAAALRRCVVRDVDGCERADAAPVSVERRDMEAAPGDMESVSDEPVSDETDRRIVRQAEHEARVGVHDPARGAASPVPGLTTTRVINGATAAALRGIVLADGDGCERVCASPASVDRLAMVVAEDAATGWGTPPGGDTGARAAGERAQSVRSG